MGEGRVLGVDVGTRTTGLAVSDELRLCVRPLPPLTPRGRDDDVKHVLGLCRDLKVRVVVVGLPLLPVSEQEGWMAKRARGFGQALQQAAQAEGLPLDVELVDERGTSRLARSRLARRNLSRARRRGRVDTEVACLLVEEFIARGTEDDVTCDV
ncbi:MAG: Holliday junction resolvase RuvX [Myxococcota bacterium]